MIDLGFLTDAEQEAILKVLHRDAELKKSEEERVRQLQDVVSDENELKYKSGQWFYEAKSKRHREKIHGADLVRASIRKRKKPSTIAELSEISKAKSKRRWLSSVNQDIFIPPELYGVMEVSDEEEDQKPSKAETNQSSKRVSFLSPETEKGILKNGMASPAKQRKNPFNSEGLEDEADLVIDPPNQTLETTGQANGQGETRPDIMSSIVKYGVKLPYPALTSGTQSSPKAENDDGGSSPKPAGQTPIPKPRKRYTNGQITPDRSNSPLSREDSVNGTSKRRGILKRRSSSSSTDSESMRITQNAEPNKVVLPGSPILEAGQNNLFDEQFATSENSPDRLKQVRFSESVLQKPPSPSPETYSGREVGEFRILDPSLSLSALDNRVASEDPIPIQLPYPAVDNDKLVEILGQKALLEDPSVSVTVETPSNTPSLKVVEQLADPKERIRNNKELVLEDTNPEISIDSADPEPLYATVKKTPKPTTLDQAEEFDMDDALMEPRFLGQRGKIQNIHHSETPLEFGKSYGGGGKLSYESRYPNKKPKKDDIFTGEEVYAPERASNVESSCYDPEDKPMAVAEPGNDYVESVAAWRRPFILKSKESSRQPSTDIAGQPTTYTLTVQEVPKVDFKDKEEPAIEPYPKNGTNSKYTPGEYTEGTKYKSIFLRDPDDSEDRPVGFTSNFPVAQQVTGPYNPGSGQTQEMFSHENKGRRDLPKSANFKVMSLKDRTSEMPKEQMPNPSQFQSLKHFWNVEEKNQPREKVDTSSNTILSDVLNKNKPTRTDLKQRNSKEIPADDLMLPSTFDSLSEEEQTSQKVASWLAQTPTVYGVETMDHSEEQLYPGEEVIENIQKSSADKKSNAQDFNSALEKLREEAFEAPRIHENGRLRTEEIQNLPLEEPDSVDNTTKGKRPPAETIDRSFYQRVTQMSNKPSPVKGTNTVAWNTQTMSSLGSREPVEESVEKTLAPAKTSSEFKIGFEKLKAEHDSLSVKPHEEYQIQKSNLPHEDLSEEEAEEVIEKSTAPKNRDQQDFISALNKLEIEASAPPLLPTESNENQDNLSEEEMTTNTVSPVKSSYKIGFEHLASSEDIPNDESPVEHSLAYQAHQSYPSNNEHSDEDANEVEETREKTTVSNRKDEKELDTALKKLKLEAYEVPSIDENVEKPKLNPTLQTNFSTIQRFDVNPSTSLSHTEEDQSDLKTQYLRRFGRSVEKVEEPPKEDFYVVKRIPQTEQPKYTVNGQGRLPVEEETIERATVESQENSADFHNRLILLQDEATTVSEEPEALSISDPVRVSQFPNRAVFISKKVFPSIESIPTINGKNEGEKTEVVNNESSSPPRSKPQDHNEPKSQAYARYEELAKYPRSPSDESGSSVESAGNVLYNKPESPPEVPKTKQGKPALAGSPSDSVSSKHDKYTFEVMKAQDQSISKVLDWFSRSSDKDDDRSPSVGLMENSKNSPQQILIHTGTTEEEPGSSVDKLVNVNLTPEKTESIYDYELPKVAEKPQVKQSISSMKTINPEQSNMLNVEMMTPVNPTEDESISGDQIHSNLEAGEPLEFGKSGSGCGKMHNPATNDDSVEKDLQFQVVEQGVTEKQNEVLDIEMEAIDKSLLKPASLVMVGAGGTPGVDNTEKEQVEVLVTKTGPHILEQGESLQNSKWQELEKHDVPQRRVSNIKLFWEGDRPPQVVAKKSVLNSKCTFSPKEIFITPRSASVDSDDQSGSGIVTFKKVMLEEEEDDQLSPIDQLKSFWENEKSKVTLKGRPDRQSMKNRGVDNEREPPVADPKPKFRKRHTFHYFFEKEPITGPVNDSSGRSVSLSEHSNEGVNDQQKSSNFQSLRSFWNVDNKSKGNNTNPQVQALSETTNRQFNSNPDITSKDQFIAKDKPRLVSKSLEDIRERTPAISHIQPNDTKPECKNKVSISSKLGKEKSDTGDRKDSLDESESLSKRFSASKQEFDGHGSLQPLKREVSEESSSSVEHVVEDASPALYSSHSSFIQESKMDKAVPTQEPVTVQKPGYESEDDKPEINPQSHLVISLPQKTSFLVNLKNTEPSLEEKSTLMHPVGVEEAQEVLENPSFDTNLKKLYNECLDSRPDEPNATKMTLGNQNSSENKLKQPSNSTDVTFQESSAPSEYLTSSGTVSDEAATEQTPYASLENLTEVSKPRKVVSEVVLKSFSPRKAEISEFGLRLRKLRDEWSDKNSSSPGEWNSTSCENVPVKVMSSEPIENNQNEFQDEENGERIYSNITNEGVRKMFLVKQSGFDTSLSKSPVDSNVSGSPQDTIEKSHSKSDWAIQKDKLSDSSEVPINETIEKTVVPRKKGFIDFDRGLQNLYNESLDTPTALNGNLAKNEHMGIQEPYQDFRKVLAVSSSKIGSSVQRSASKDKKATFPQTIIINVSSKKTDDCNDDLSRNTPNETSSVTQAPSGDVPRDTSQLNQEEQSNSSLAFVRSTSDLRNSSDAANLISEKPRSELNVSSATETDVSALLSQSIDHKGNIAPPEKQSRKEIVERIQSPIILPRTQFNDFDEKLKKLYEESRDLKPTLVEATGTQKNEREQSEQQPDVCLFSSETKTTFLKSSKANLESSPTIPAERRALIDKTAASGSQDPDILVQEVRETIEKTVAPTRIFNSKSLEKLQREALDDEEGRFNGNMPPDHVSSDEYQPRLSERVLKENRVSEFPPKQKEASVQEKMEPSRYEESQECTPETQTSFASVKQSTPMKEKNGSLRRSTLELYLETPYRREMSKSIDFELSGYVPSNVDKERCMEESNLVLRALKRSAAKPLNSKAVQEVSPTSTNEVKLDDPKEVALAPAENSFPENAEKLKRLSQSVPAFLQDDTDGRETDSASESSFQIGRHKKSPSSLTNLSGSSGMASMSSVCGSVMSMYSGDFGNIDIKGVIEFSIDYVEQLKEFLIYIYQCKELAAADVKKQRSDPYVKTYLIPKKSKMGKRKTAVKKKTLNPVYNEILRYKIPKQNLVSQTLNLSVWHYDVLGRNSFLGEVNVDLVTWDWTNTQRNWYQLEPRTPAGGMGIENRGEMKLSLKYVPVTSPGTGTKGSTTGEVHIWIKECLQLPMLRENKINSFVKCTILPDTSRKSRQKTRAVNKTPNPIFNHTMVYDGFKKEDLREACVELTVWDHNRLSNHFMGGLRIGLGSGKSYGTAVDWMDSSHEESTMWEKMISSPDTWIEGMLPLRMFKMAKLAK